MTHLILLKGINQSTHRHYDDHHDKSPRPGSLIPPCRENTTTVKKEERGCWNNIE